MHKLVVVLCATLFPEKAISSNHKGAAVIVAYPKSDQDNLNLVSLEKTFDVHLLSAVTRLYDPIELGVPTNSISEVQSKLRAWNISFAILTDDLQKSMDAEMAEKEKLRKAKGRANDVHLSFVWFYEFNEIISYFERINKVYTANVMLRVIGITFENRPIYTLAVGLFDFYSITRPVVIIECGIHAREWISPAACLWIIQSLLTDQRQMLTEYTFHFVPVANPDGYVYSWSPEPTFWRRNRKPIFQNGTLYHGVDINRNFEFMFGAQTVPPTSDPKVDNYRGPYAFSEEEAQALRDLVQSFDKRQILAYFSVHAQGNLWMYPYGQKEPVAENILTLDRLAKLASKKIQEAYNNTFRVGSIVNLLYASSGTSMEWVKWVTNCPLSYAIEMRPAMQNPMSDKQKYVFSPFEIKEPCSEVWLGIQVILYAYKESLMNVTTF